MAKGVDPAQKIVTADYLAGQLSTAHRPSTVFTNGCFDILHAGHVSYLYRAAALADLLIVGLNSDSSVAGLKGPKRPLVPQVDRAFVLAGLSMVDYVVFFEQSTPVELIQCLRPDIHVKGGDYTEAELPEAALVRASGGRVVVLPFLEGRSSTEIIDRIRQ